MLGLVGQVLILVLNRNTGSDSYSGYVSVMLEYCYLWGRAVAYYLVSGYLG